MSCQSHIDDTISNVSFESTRRVYEQELLSGPTSKVIWKLENLLKEHFTPVGSESEGLKNGNSLMKICKFTMEVNLS